MRNADFEKVKAAADLETVVRHFAPEANLKRIGHRWRGLCPLHGEKTPSFFVEGDRFKCHGCKCGGDVFDFVKAKKGCTAGEALHVLADLFQVQIEGRPKDGQNSPFTPSKAKTPAVLPKQKENALQGKLGPFKPRFLDHSAKVAPTLAPERRQSDNLFQYLSRLYGSEAVNRVFDLYRVGADGERTCFWHTDGQGRTRFGQKIPYPVNGHHRRKDVFPAVDTLAPPDGIDSCFFGEHLLAGRPSATVQIVESAKTALICALEDPSGLWLATGGKGHLGQHNPHKWAILKGRTIVLHPDLEKPPKEGGPPPPPPWERAVPDLKKAGFAVSMGRAAETLATPTERQSGGDLADLFLARRERAVLIPPPPPPTVQAPTAGPPPITAETVKEARKKLEQVADRWPEHSEILRRFGSLYLDHFADFANGWHFGREPERRPIWENRWRILWELLGEAFPFEGEN
jgi:hypothetical protein